MPAKYPYQVRLEEDVASALHRYAVAIGGTMPKQANRIIREFFKRRKRK